MSEKTEHVDMKSPCWVLIRFGSVLYEAAQWLHCMVCIVGIQRIIQCAFGAENFDIIRIIRLEFALNSTPVLIKPIRRLR